MLKRATVAALVLGAFWIVPLYGQKSTEVYIPIGKSPGVSGKYSVVGNIGSLDEATHILTVSAEDGEHRARITKDTKIWLDRSEARKTNTAGTPADCRPGRLCEIKYVYDGEDRTDEAEWIKIRVSGSD